jgi:D-alanyl-lipoteichoic acid acyltransferase DltB (MBOAT superfamily)
MDFLFDFTILHVLISLVALVSRVGQTIAFTQGNDPYSTRLVFLVATAANLLTGFLFPFHGVTPAIVIGALNTVILVGTIVASARQNRSRLWAVSYVIGSLALLYFNCLVFIVQSFQKVPSLHAMAPVGNEPPVIVSQGVLFLVAIAAGYLCLRRTRPDALRSDFHATPKLSQGFHTP